MSGDTRESIYTRTEAMLGKDGVERLKRAHVIIFGVGGVGGYAAEALARAGVGKISVVDNDTVSPSNLNRQIIALRSTLGMPKVDAIKQRIVDINEDAEIVTHRLFFDEATASVFDFSAYDYVLDCIDSVKSKLLLIECAKRGGARIISAMGAGRKLDPSRFTVTDIKKTHTDPLARAIRSELKRRGIDSLRAVWSDEKPTECADGTLGSLSFVPSVVGLLMAREVILDIAKE